MAVFYRVNAQSRAIEEAFIRDKIPIRSFGASSFTGERKSATCWPYLKVLVNRTIKSHCCGSSIRRLAA